MFAFMLQKLNFWGEVVCLTVNHLSLTLRDAQHLCWKTFRKLALMNQKSLDQKETAVELVKKAQQIAQKTSLPEAALDKATAARALSELLYLAFVLAEQQGVDLEENFLQTVDDMILGSVA